jgi:hypothetical protein
LVRPGEVRLVAAMAFVEPISPELVLVDPALAAVERPREFALRVIAHRVVPLGAPLATRETRTWRSAWQVIAIGLCLLAAGLLASVVLFSDRSAGRNRPTIVVSTPVGVSPIDPIVGPPIPPSP